LKYTGIVYGVVELKEAPVPSARQLRFGLNSKNFRSIPSYIDSKKFSFKANIEEEN